MALKFFRKNNRYQSKASVDEYQGDGLDQKMTEIALDLIEGRGGSEFQNYFIGLFKKDPRFIQNVAPEHREELKRTLDRIE